MNGVQFYELFGGIALNNRSFLNKEIHDILTNLKYDINGHNKITVHNTCTCGSASHKFRQLNTKLNCYKYSLLPATIASWNTLPLEVRQLPSLEQFQHALSQISVSSLVYQLYGILKYYDILTWFFLLAFCRIVCAGGSYIKLSILHFGR